MSVDVQFTYPPTYPEVVPEISVISHSGISEEQMSEIETHLLSVVSSSSCVIFDNQFSTSFHVSRQRRMLGW